MPFSDHKIYFCRQLNKDGIVDDPRAQYVGTEPWSALEVILEETIRYSRFFKFWWSKQKVEFELKILVVKFLHHYILLLLLASYSSCSSQSRVLFSLQQPTTP